MLLSGSSDARNSDAGDTACSWLYDTEKELLVQRNLHWAPKERSLLPSFAVETNRGCQSSPVTPLPGTGKAEVTAQALDVLVVEGHSPSPPQEHTRAEKDGSVVAMLMTVSSNDMEPQAPENLSGSMLLIILKHNFPHVCLMGGGTFWWVWTRGPSTSDLLNQERGPLFCFFVLMWEAEELWSHRNTADLEEGKQQDPSKLRCLRYSCTGLMWSYVSVRFFRRQRFWLQQWVKNMTLSTGVPLFSYEEVLACERHNEMILWGAELGIHFVWP